MTDIASKNGDDDAAAESRALNDELYGSDTAATDYESWEENNVIMQEYSYYTIMNELSNIGIKDKTFMDVGCGPCPIGQQLVAKGAKKVFGVDVSQAMLDRAQTMLEEKGIADKFELVQGNILDDTFKLDEQVDVVVASYVIASFISNSEVLAEFISCCKDKLKPGGYLLIMELSYCGFVKEDSKFKYGFYDSTIGPAPPEPFEAYNFTYLPPNNQPGTVDLFNLPPRTMFEAALSAHFSDIQYKRCYMNPAFQSDELVRTFNDAGTDYVLLCKNETK